MTHELKKIIEKGIRIKKKGMKSVLATVVALDGSSYRKPGVRMLISEDRTMTGAVSGGCVEKEVLLQALLVLKDDMPRVMTYDGRYRLGCEGILYILIEPFDISEKLRKYFEGHFKERKRFLIESYFKKEEIKSSQMGSVICFEDGTKSAFSGHLKFEQHQEVSVFRQEMKPLFKMLIFGSEHDSVQLCSAAFLLGWEVTVVTSPKDPKTMLNFPGAQELLHIGPGEAENLRIDEDTAVVLMNHNYATDLKYLLAIKDKNPVYIGLLGSVKRREKLFGELIAHYPEISDTLLDKIYGPAGLDIGAVTPQEIAVSILSEVLTVTRKKEGLPLRQKQGKIHN